MKINNLESILTQNHLSTSDPVFCVYSKQEIYVDGEGEYDKMVLIKNGDPDYQELLPNDFEKLESEYYNATDYRNIAFDGDGEQIISEMPKDPFDEESDFDPDDWEPRYIKYVDKFEQAFFIRQNAENFLANQSHNLGDGAYIYVESAYRNPEWQQIRKMLVDKALIESHNVTA